MPPTGSGGEGKRWEFISWRIRLERNGQTIETDYAQGIGCIPREILVVPYGRRTVAQQERIEAVMETGRAQRGGRKCPPPSLPDVLHSLVSDSDVLDHPTYESWAGDFGYDPDSRKGEAIYRQCLEIALKMRTMFGESGLEELRELFQDY